LHCKLALDDCQRNRDVRFSSTNNIPNVERQVRKVPERDITGLTLLKEAAN
jgi:hypothetical protein